MGYYLERNDEKLAIQMLNFASKIDLYAGTFGLNGTETASIKADASYFGWAVNNIERIDTYKKNRTSFKTILLKGENGVTSNIAPIAPTLDAAPAPVAPGVLPRFTSMVNRIKAHLAYTTAIGQNLGIESSTVVTAGIAVADAKPQIKLTVNGGRVLLQWSKGSYSGIIIEKDSGSGFAMLDKDFVPDFIDNSPMPGANAPAVWKYRAIYLLRDDKVGQWSDVVSITVGS